MSQKQTEITRLTDYHALGSKSQPCLIVVSGYGIAQRYWLDRPENIIGRLFDCHIMLNEANVSRQHARVLALGDSFLLEDLGSTNGTYVNSSKLTRPHRLADGDLIGIGETVFKFAIQSAIDDAFYNEMLEAARLDSLTGLLNRRYFDKHLAAEFARIDRYGGCVSLLLCDLDDFKAINDRHGHPAGDLVLSQVGERLRGCLRQQLDLPSRYGGEELAVLLPEIGPDQALTVAEKIRAAVAERPTVYQGRPLQVTLSIGVASSGDGVDSPKKLITAADERLYRAKRDGKNRVVN